MKLHTKSWSITGWLYPAVWCLWTEEWSSLSPGDIVTSFQQQSFIFRTSLTTKHIFRTRLTTKEHKLPTVQCTTPTVSLPLYLGHQENSILDQPFHRLMANLIDHLARLHNIKGMQWKKSYQLQQHHSLFSMNVFDTAVLFPLCKLLNFYQRSPNASLLCLSWQT